MNKKNIYSLLASMLLISQASFSQGVPMPDTVELDEIILSLPFNQDRGKSVINQTGELVCIKPFPSMPNYFWNDENNQKYIDAYFTEFKDVWTHGDFVEINHRGGV